MNSINHHNVVLPVFPDFLLFTGKIYFWHRNIEMFICSQILVTMKKAVNSNYFMAGMNNNFDVRTYVSFYKVGF
jgi:hypothetical protein